MRDNPKYRAVFSTIHPTAYLVSIRLIIYICSHSSLFLLLLLLSLWLYTIGICRWNNHIPKGSAFRLLYDPPISVLQGLQILQIPLLLRLSHKVLFSKQLLGNLGKYVFIHNKTFVLFLNFFETHVVFGDGSIVVKLCQ